MRLKNIQRVFEELDSKGVRYCHWKSNEHLLAALQGDTDLDILFDYSQISTVEEVLRRNDFHLFVAPWYRNYDGIVDYIGFDEDTGKTVHIHTHYKLMIGEVGVKSFHLPWEEIILDNTIVDEHDFKVVSPEMEYLLLIVRTALKFQKFNSSSNKQIAAHFRVEGQWLHNRTQSQDIIALSDTNLTSDISQIITEILEAQDFDLTSFEELNKKLKAFLKENRKLSVTRVLSIQLMHLSSKIKVKASIMRGSRTAIQKRRLPHRGIIVTLMGPDGAGKSTQTKAIVQELRKKVDVLYMYLGSGDGAKSIQRKTISKVTSLGKTVFAPAKEHKKKSPQRQSKTSSAKGFNLSSDPRKFAIQLSRLLSIAREKKRRLQKIEKARKKGVIVICDRYPQTSIFNYNDGPKLQSLKSSSSYFLRRMAEYEYNCYVLANAIAPDLVIKLTGDPLVLASRRPEMEIEEIIKKQDGIKAISYGSETKHVNIDIDQEVTAIKGMILAEISKAIRHNNGSL